LLNSISSPKSFVQQNLSLFLFEEVDARGFEAISKSGSTGKEGKNGYLRYAELIRKLIELGIRIRINNYRS